MAFVWPSTAVCGAPFAAKYMQKPAMAKAGTQAIGLIVIIFPLHFPSRLPARKVKDYYVGKAIARNCSLRPAQLECGEVVVDSPQASAGATKYGHRRSVVQ